MYKRQRVDDEKLLLGTISHNFCHKNESYISFETMVESSDAPIQWAVDVYKRQVVRPDLAPRDDRRTAVRILRKGDVAYDSARSNLPSRWSCC